MRAESATVRFAHSADAANLVVLAEKTFIDAFGAHNSETDMADYVSTAFTLRQLESEIADSRNVFLLAEHADGLIGYTKLRDGVVPECVHGHKPIELERIYVEQRWFGQGVATMIMDATLDEAARRGHESVWLGVWEANPRARAFYEKYDFGVVGTKDFLLGEARQTDLIMERRS